MLSHNEKKRASQTTMCFFCLQLLKIGSYHTLLSIVLSASVVGKAATEYELSVTKGRMSPMKMIEVFVVPSIDLGSKLICVDIVTS